MYRVSATLLRKITLPSSQQPRAKSFSKTLSVGGIIGLAATSASVLATSSVVLCAQPSEPGVPDLVTELPSDLDLAKCDVKLYQFESCPFCRKARAVLDLARIPYRVVEVNPLTKSETKPFASDYKKVPIVVIEDSGTGRKYQVRDSKVIINAILRAAKVTVGGRNSSTPFPTPAALNAETVLDAKVYEGMTIDEAWIKWVESYLLQLVVVNIYGTMDESKETFDYLLTHKDFGWVAKQASYWAGSIVMNQVARSRLKKFTSIQGHPKQAFFDACADLGKAAKSGGGFIGGSRPSSADLNAYGVIRSLEGTKSLREAIAGGAGEEFKLWYANMNATVGESQAISKANTTERGSQ